MAAGAAINSAKIIYQQVDVFVHTAVPSSTFYDDIIRGQLQIIEKEYGVSVEWQPVSDLTPEVEYEVHSLFSGPHEYGVVTTQESGENITTQPNTLKRKSQPYRVTFDVEKIHSIRRSDPRLAWSYVVFILKDGSTQPALHFHSGGINEMISILQRFVWLTKSPTNTKLYIVQERDSAMDSTLNQFELFTDNHGHSVQHVLNNTYYGALNAFAKVTQTVLGRGQQGLQERRPARPPPPSRRTLSDVETEYEFLNHEEPDVLGPVIPAARGSSLQPEEWCSFMNDEGIITDVERLKERIFRGGIDGDIKKEAWKFLLGYYKFEHTYEERALEKEQNKKFYHTMKTQWSTITPVQEKRFTEFANRKHLVDKDALRTDRKNPFYAGDNNENVKMLNDILMTYCMYNFDLGYVQGMSDLLSPILQLMEDEVDAFWCFVGLMDMEENNFEMTQHMMKQQLNNLAKLVEFIYPNFWKYLNDHESGNLFFCFRWMLISFKRDFGLGDLMTLWEVVWTQNLTPHFKLFICLAILEREKDMMMKYDYGFNEILKHINELSGQIDLQSTLSRAESICLQLRNTKNLPKEIKELVFHPHELDNNLTEEEEDSDIEKLTESVTTPEITTFVNGDTEENLNNAHGVDRVNVSAQVQQDMEDDKRDRTSDEAVVELSESTQSVF